MVQSEPDMDMGLTLRQHDVRGVTVVAIRGSVDLDTAPDLDAALKEAGRSERPVVADARGVDVLDSTGLRILLDARSAQRRSGTSFGLVRDPSGQVARMLAVAGAGRFLPAYDTVDEAVDALLDGSG